MTLYHKLQNKCADDCNTALPNPEAPADPATQAEEGWMAPTPLLVEGGGPSRGPDTSGKNKNKVLTLLQNGSPANLWEATSAEQPTPQQCLLSNLEVPHLYGYECFNYQPLRSSHVKLNQLCVKHECIRTY